MFELGRQTKSGDRLVQQSLALTCFFPDELGEAHPVIAAVFPGGHMDSRGAVLSCNHVIGESWKQFCSDQPSTS